MYSSNFFKNVSYALNDFVPTHTCIHFLYSFTCPDVLSLNAGASVFLSIFNDQNLLSLCNFTLLYGALRKFIAHYLRICLCFGYVFMLKYIHWSIPIIDVSLNSVLTSFKNKTSWQWRIFSSHSFEGYDVVDCAVRWWKHRLATKIQSIYSLKLLQ